MNKSKKILAAFAIVSCLCLSFISPASATIVGEDTKYGSVPGTTNQLSGTVLINKSTTSPYPVNAYAQTIISGFLQGTAPVDSLSVSLVACVQGTCSKKETASAILGQSTPTITIQLGNADGSLVYTATGNHSAKKSGVTYSTPNTSAIW